MGEERFRFAFDPRFVPVLAAIGARESNSEVVLGDDVLDARFGPWRFRTEISNLRGVEISRDYRWVRAIGVRWSLADWGLTFGSNTRAGVCVCFHEPVPSFWTDRIRHPGLTVTVEDVDGFAAAVERRLVDLSAD